MDSTIVSIIIPIYNGESWINECFNSILQQEGFNKIKVEVCVCNDASADNTSEVLNSWITIFKDHAIELRIFENLNGTPGGVGYSKNQAVAISTGTYLCFQDIDDVMFPKRVLKQYEAALSLPRNVIIGSRFRRSPPNSTERYTRWANSLKLEQLHKQIYTSHGPTVIMPTWFCHRSVFNQVGGFSETGKGTPEDLIFFYRHLDLGGKLFRVDDCLLIYTYHQEATTFSIHESAIWNIRLERLQQTVLKNWNQFTIWNGGKQGRHFFHSLSEENQVKVVAFCDVDIKKIGKKYIPYDPVSRKVGKSIDIIHFQEAVPPFIICVKTDLTNGEFESNLHTLKLIENVDYIMFS